MTSQFAAFQSLMLEELRLIKSGFPPAQTAPHTHPTHVTIDSGSSFLTDEVMSTKRPKAGAGSTEATDGAGRELDGSSEPSSREELERLLKRELDGSLEPSSNEEFALLLERKLDGSLVLSSSVEFARLLEIDTERLNHCI